jgi:trimethylamine--corrinoid protein Co-methyltransferase
VTDPEPTESDGQTPRRRSGGREGHARSLLPPQRPWAQPRIRYRPTEVLSADEIESIHLASLRVLAEIGMDFLDEGARNLLKDAGADVRPDSQRVRFDPAMVEERIKTAPSTFTLHAPNPEHDIVMGADWTAFGTVGSAPNVADLDRGRRVGNRADYRTSSGWPDAQLGHFFAIRVGRSTSTRRSATPRDYDVVTLADKPFHAYSPAGVEPRRARDARPSAAWTRRPRPGPSTHVINSSSRSGWTRRCSTGSSSTPPETGDCMT